MKVMDCGVETQLIKKGEVGFCNTDELFRPWDNATDVFFLIHIFLMRFYKYLLELIIFLSFGHVLFLLSVDYRREGEIELV